MRSVVVAAVIAMAMAPAAAQQSGTQSKDSPSAQSGTQSHAAAQSKLRQSLEQAGFKDIKVVDAAYLVHARTGDGNLAVMYIDPPQAASGTTGSSAAGGQSPAMTQSKVRESLEKAGFKEVKIVDASYMVTAQTSDGGRTMMYINPPSAATPAQTSPGSTAPKAMPQSK
jgi:mannitol-specific phosphotransferase system IIBC component